MSGMRTAFVAFPHLYSARPWLPDWAVVALRVDGGYRIFDSIDSFQKFDELRVTSKDELRFGKDATVKACHLADRMIAQGTI